MSIIIHTQDLVKRYRTRTVVNDVSIEVKQGEIVGLLGPNGAGKTTTFYMTVGLIKPDAGKVFINEQDITKLPMYKRAQMGIGYLPQEASVFRKLSIEDNISAVLEMTDLSKKEQKEKLESLIKEFRLEHVRKSNGDVVSGGERRRTEIARALAVNPKFILLDEPFAGIDPIAVEDIQAIVARLKFKNIGILITDHNVTETLSICDRAYLLIEGKIFKHGTAEELAEDEQVRKLYLGRNFELKRKDWLLEEFVQTEEYDSSFQNRLIQLCDYVMEKTNELLSQMEKKGASGISSDLRVDEYFQQLKETKVSLRKFGSNIRHQELLTRASEIPDLEYEDYKTVFDLFDFSTTTAVYTNALRGATSLAYKQKLDQLEVQLQEVKTILGKCSIYLKAAEV
ncbi:MAG TPA: LPS export ABC transporter ATP-binding protein [Flavisolibacter sp.]|nr:LPS export ABC transporter ATP-binding protein [Flavisolibacter sp.]